MGVMTALDVVLGMCFIFMLFALIASAVNEAIAALLDSRAKHLRHGLVRLFANPEIVKELKAKSRIGYLFSDEKATLPPSFLPARELLSAVIDFSKPTSLAQQIEALPDSPMKRTLVEIGQTTQHEWSRFQAAFELWHLNFESQVRSWYRRKTHAVLFGISLAMAVAFNIDALSLIGHLGANPDARAALVARAVAVDGPIGGAAAEQFRAAQTEWAEANRILDQANNASERSAAINALEESETRMVDAGKALHERFSEELAFVDAHLPLGWTRAEWVRVRGDACLILAKSLGLLFSAFAIALGSPFWFDLLKKVTSIRAVGRSPSDQSR